MKKLYFILFISIFFTTISYTEEYSKVKTSCDNFTSWGKNVQEQYLFLELIDYFNVDSNRFKMCVKHQAKKIRPVVVKQCELGVSFDKILKYMARRIKRVCEPEYSPMEDLWLEWENEDLNLELPFPEKPYWVDDD